MEVNHFDKDGAKFILEVAKNNCGLVLPGCQPVYNPCLLYTSVKSLGARLMDVLSKIFLLIPVGLIVYILIHIVPDMIIQKLLEQTAIGQTLAGNVLG